MTRSGNEMAAKGGEISRRVTTLVDLVETRARHEGGKRALTFLQDGETEAGHLTCAELHEQARSIAASLQEMGLAGERVLLLYPSGLEFVAAFLGCLYAGVVAIPAYPPKTNRNLIRLQSIVSDSQSAAALTSASVRRRMQPMLGEAGLATLRLVATDTFERGNGARWRRPQADYDALAFLQYTSGSTSHPKGVMVTHGNLLENQRMMQRAFGQTPESRIVNWLPLFHDMGLIGNVLQGLYLGNECIIMPPEVFLVKPVRWLAAISRYQARFSGAPNFAFELCVKKVTEEQRAALDLSCWDSAFVGAEPVRAQTMERFAAAFASCGLRREALFPCYGLAEASLFVSGPGKLTGANTAWFSAAALEKHRVVPRLPGDGDDARELVNCGHTWLDQQIAIVDPESGERCGLDRVGEIWVSGGHVARGYWNRPDETARTFAARLSGGEEDTKFLRTGDLGFMHQGGLFVTGRLKDLIIIAGRNHDPVDIEHTVQACHPAIRHAGCAAFQVDIRGEARLVIVAELERTCGVPVDKISATGGAPAEARVITQAVREAVALGHDLAIYEIVFLKPAALPKTSSGKIQRHACRADYLSDILKRWNPK